MTECASSHAPACPGEEWAERRREWVRASNLDHRLRRRDKRGSPAEPQAIDKTWVLACPSVGASAAGCVLNNAIKNIFSTVGGFARLEARL
jgi:hypothetical protein